MRSFTDKWKGSWVKKRAELANRVFNFKNIVHFHSKTNDVLASRDMELARLQSTGEDVYQGSTGTDSMLACKFCPLQNFSHIVASGDEKGDVTLLNVNKCFKEPEAVLPAQDNALFDIVWQPGEMKLLTVSGDRKARLWDIDKLALISVFAGHEHSVKTGSFMPGHPEIFATGGRDGKICLWDSRVSKKASSCIVPDRIVNNAAGELTVNKKTLVNSVTGLAFQDSNLLWCTGSTDKYIRMYDMRRPYQSWKPGVARTSISSPCSGFTDLKLSPDGNKLYASAMKSNIYCYNINSCDDQPIGQFTGHHANSYYIRLCVSSDGEYLASGSTSETVCVWKTAGAHLTTTPRNPYLKLTGHTGEVACVDICQRNMTTVVTCGDDSSVRLWRPTAILEQDEPRIPTLSIMFAELQLETHSDVPETLASIAEETPEATLTEPVITQEEVRVTPCTPPPSSSTKTHYTGGKRRMQETSPTRENTESRKRLVLSPSKRQTENTDYSSPTMNLPNYVLEGSGPSHSCPRMRQKENTDWLTELGRQKSAGKKATSAEKPARRPSQTGKKSSRRTLLEYYKKSAKSCDDASQSQKSQERLVTC